MLRGALRRDRVPSALLLCGDAGIGKRMAAIETAKAVNCLSPDDGDCCDACGSCRKIRSGVHPDVTIVGPEGDEIRIEAVRRVIETLLLSPFEGRTKVVVIEDAEAMNINAANAFLKTLEEPPEHTLIMLLSSNPDKLPPTIRSRCAPVRFSPLPAGMSADTLGEQVQGEAHDFVARLVVGRPGLASVRDFVEERDRFVAYLGGMCRGEAKQIWQDRSEIKSWIEMAGVYLRDLAVKDATGRPELLFFGTIDRPGDMEAALKAYRQLETLKALVDLNLNKSITWMYVSTIMRQVLGPDARCFL